MKPVRCFLPLAILLVVGDGYSASLSKAATEEETFSMVNTARDRRETELNDLQKLRAYREIEIALKGRVDSVGHETRERRGFASLPGFFSRIRTSSRHLGY